jgi:hypothetical protein
MIGGAMETSGAGGVCELEIFVGGGEEGFETRPGFCSAAVRERQSRVAREKCPVSLMRL